MSDKNSLITIKGMGFTTTLTVIFVVLKLIGVIDWSLVWVLSPLWISAILAVSVIIITLIVYVVYFYVKKHKKEKV